jgi:hypothetical protein
VIFKHPTIRGMADAMSAQTTAQPEPIAAIPRASRRDYSVSLKPEDPRN